MLQIFHKELNPASRQQLDGVLTNLLPHLRQNAKKKFPRIYFPQGITAMSKMTADETIALLFITVFILNTSMGKQAILENSRMSLKRIETYIEAFQKLLVFHAWLKKKTGFWLIGDILAKQRALSAIKSLVNFICKYFKRETEQGWSLSKIHELFHIPHYIELFGAPSNFDSGPCERMHKEIAKRPGRRAQKQHERFTFQAAQRLADRHVLDKAYHDIVRDYSLPENDEENSNSYEMMTSFYMHLLLGNNPVPEGTCLIQNADDNDEDNTLHFVISKSPNFNHHPFSPILYPHLLDFLKSEYCRDTFRLRFPIRFGTEYYGDDLDMNTIYRAHYNYHNSGPWHDWVWMRYEDDTKAEGFMDVPAKLLGFIYDEQRNHSDVIQAICHPCKWTSQKIGSMVKKWTLDTTPENCTFNIPYDIVAACHIQSHCLVIPEIIDNKPNIYVIIDPDNWPNKFCT